MFKDKKGGADDDLDGPPTGGDKPSKKKGLFKSRKAEASSASVTHFAAELDRSADDQPVTGLSPAAKLARQHTLRSKAEDAAAASARANRRGPSAVDEDGRRPSIDVPPTWDKNTVNRHGAPAGLEEEAWPQDGQPSAGDNDSFGHSDDDGHGGYDGEDDVVDDVASRMADVGVADPHDDGAYESWGASGPLPPRTPPRSILKSQSALSTCLCFFKSQSSDRKLSP